MNRRRSGSRLNLAALALLPNLGWASANPRAPEDLEEVQIIASRHTPDELRAEIVKTEDAFYARLNELMDDPEMRVECRFEPPVGSHISRRVCAPQYIATANANYTRDMIQGLTLTALTPGGVYFTAAAPGAAIAGNEVVFVRKVDELVTENPALRELAQRREKLEILLKAAQKARFKGNKAKVRTSAFDTH